MVAPDKSSQDKAQSKLKRREFIKVSGAGAVVATAGCLGGDGGDGSDGGGSDGGDSGGGSDGSDGGGGSGTATELDVDEIVFGQLSPQPGEFAAGTAFQEFGELFVEQINEDGGVLGTEVKLVEKNTELDPSVARERYRELILEDEADVTFGIFLTEAGVVVQDQLSEFQTPHISGGVAGSNIPQQISDNYEKYRYWFRSNWNGSQQGNAIAQFAQDNFADYGFERIAVAAEDVAGFDPIVENAVSGLPDSVDIAFEESYSSDTTDFSPILDRAESEEIDFLLAFIGFGGIPLILQWNQRSAEFGLGGGDTLSATQAQYENTDGAVEGLLTYVPGSGPGFEHTEMTTEVIQAHNDLHGHDPVHANGFTHYESMETYVRAVEAVGSLNVDDIINYIESDLEYNGTVGPMTYHGQDGKYPHDTVYSLDHSPPVIQWQNGKQVGLWPETNRTGEYNEI
jgi:branched-chain amino acid transport system substrate-binding protein